jgi:hypothetical protein
LAHQAFHFVNGIRGKANRSSSYSHGLSI